MSASPPPASSRPAEQVETGSPRPVAAGAGRGARRAAVTVVVVLLSAQVVALLLVGTYARVGPRLGGFPFFYWYTLLWLVVGAVSLAACGWLLRRTAPAQGGDAR